MADAAYIQGETITYNLADTNYTAATLHLGATKYPLVLSASVWSVSIDSTALSGRYRFAAIADGFVRDSGILTVSPLVSKYRAVIDAIDTALQGVATNGKYSMSIGEISLQDKTFDEMVKAKNYYSRMAEADETGIAPTFGPSRVSETYA